MRTFETMQNADADKIVRLSIPVEQANRPYRVVVMVEPVIEWQALTPPTSVWPPGFFESTAGKWVGEFERPPSGNFEQREDL